MMRSSDRHLFVVVCALVAVAVLTAAWLASEGGAAPAAWRAGAFAVIAGAGVGLTLFNPLRA